MLKSFVLRTFSGLDLVNINPTDHAGLGSHLSSVRLPSSALEKDLNRLRILPDGAFVSAGITTIAECLLK